MTTPFTVVALWRGSCLHRGAGTAYRVSRGDRETSLAAGDDALARDVPSNSRSASDPLVITDLGDQRGISGRIVDRELLEYLNRVVTTHGGGTHCGDGDRRRRGLNAISDGENTPRTLLVAKGDCRMFSFARWMRLGAIPNFLRRGLRTLHPASSRPEKNAA
jgi:hypothetical protein